jgi:hypothetical protein
VVVLVLQEAFVHWTYTSAPPVTYAKRTVPSAGAMVKLGRADTATPVKVVVVFVLHVAFVHWSKTGAPEAFV